MNEDTYEHTFDEDIPLQSGTTPNCPECGGLVYTNSIETVCEDCGLVLTDTVIDHGPEWTPYDAPGKRRVGSPVTPARHDLGISAEVGRYRDGNGEELSPQIQRDFRRLRRWNRRARFTSQAEQNLAHALSEIRRIGGALDLADGIIAEASQLFRAAQSADLIRGRSLESMTSAAVYAACRLRRLPRYLDEIAEVSHGTQRSVRRAYLVLNRELALQVPPCTPGDVLPRVASDLEFSDTVRERAIQLCDLKPIRTLSNGRNPATVAAGCLYFASREIDGSNAVTQAEVASAARVTPASFRAIWQALQNLDLPCCPAPYTSDMPSLSSTHD